MIWVKTEAVICINTGIVLLVRTTFEERQKSSKIADVLDGTISIMV